MSDDATTSAPPLHVPITELVGPAFRLPLPEGWVDRSVYLVGGPEIDGFQLSVAVTAEHQPELQDFAAFVEDQCKQLEGQLDSFALQAKEDAKLGPHPSIRLEYTWVSPEGHELRQLQWYTHRAPNVVVLTAGVPVESFDQVRGEIEAIATGFDMAAVKTQDPPDSDDIF